MNVSPKRIRLIHNGYESNGPVVYWMSRDQRVSDNWALLFAQQKAVEMKQPLLVCFCLSYSFLRAPLRPYDFMLQGLRKVNKQLHKKGIPFFLITGDAPLVIPPFLKKHKAGLLVTDFDPLRIKCEWKKGVAARAKITIYEVDAHNIVPCWTASEKQEYGAYTIRPKIQHLLSEFLTDYPALRKHPFTLSYEVTNSLNVDEIKKTLSIRSEKCEPFRSSFRNELRACCS